MQHKCLYIDLNSLTLKNSPIFIRIYSNLLKTILFNCLIGCGRLNKATQEVKDILRVSSTQKEKCADQL